MSQKIISSLLVLILINIPIQSYAENNYQLEIDEHFFDIEYTINGNVIAMAVDNELNSLLIATENVQDDLFQITLPSELIRAENNEFAVLVNGLEVNYDIVDGDSVILSFFLPDFTEEIEIIGTYVVPEYPLGVMFILISLIGIIVILQKSKILLFR